MPDITAIELAEEDVSAQPTSLLTDVRRFAVGALFTAALAAVGTVLFTLALALAVVGSPVIAAAIVYAVARRQRAARPALDPAVG